MIINILYISLKSFSGCLYQSLIFCQKFPFSDLTVAGNPTDDNASTLAENPQPYSESSGLEVDTVRVPPQESVCMAIHIIFVLSSFVTE